MYTGIIEELGEVAEIKKNHAVWQFRIKASKAFTRLKIGSSVACSGACLTIVAQKRGCFTVELSSETLKRTHLGDWAVGTKVNLERAMAALSRFEGHIVAGHIDGTAELMNITRYDKTSALTLKAPVELSRFIAAKGSVALDGVALTVNTVQGDLFDIMIIPHTLELLQWQQLQVGTKFNLEVDMLARYVARLLERTA